MKITQVDAFTDRPFAGNPAAVCILPSPAGREWMQAVAREMNLSETAFLVPRAAGARQQEFDLRWFTPAVEVDLCGHATLASAHVLFETGQVALETTIEFFTRSGVLYAGRAADWIWLDFPARPVRPAEIPDYLLRGLGVEPRFVGRSAEDYFVELADEQTVRQVAPDFGLLRRAGARGVVVSAPGSGEFDIVSRFFCPGVGIDEDPVTGSAHCALAVYWSERLGRDRLTAFQASPRGGVVKVQLQGERVLLQGQAVTVMVGELHGRATSSTSERGPAV